MAESETYTLNDGVGLPKVGFGTFQMRGQTVKDAVTVALIMGYVNIDTAQAYGNHAQIGEALTETGLQRSDYFISTKLWPGGFGNQPSKTPEEVREFVQEALRDLRTDYLDLVLIHAPFAVETRVEQYRALHVMKNEGLIRSVGVSNYGVHHIQELLNAGLPMPSVNQIEINPLCQNRQLVEFCEANNIRLIAYGSLSALSNWRQGDRMSKNNSEDHESQFYAIAEKHNVTVAKVLMKWALQKGYAILPKSKTPDRIEQNIKLSFMLDAQDMSVIDSFDRQLFLCWRNGLDPAKVP